MRVTLGDSPCGTLTRPPWRRALRDGLLTDSIVSAFVGLLLSYHFNTPSGPSIVLTAGAVYVASLLLGRRGSLATHLFPHHKHFDE